MAKDTGATITSVQIKATADTSSAQRSIKALADKIKSLKTSVGEGIKLPSAKKIEAFAEAMSKLKGIRWTTIANGINNVADALGRISVLKIDNSVIRQMQAIQNEMTSTKSKAKEVKDAVKEVTQATTATVLGKEVSQNVKKPPTGKVVQAPKVGKWMGEKYDSSKVTTEVLKANGALLKMQALASLVGVAFDKIEAGIRRLAASVVSLGAKAAVSLGKTIGRVALSPWKNLLSNIKDSVKGLANFLTAVKRIAIYRGIRFVLKEISQAFREGIGNLYQYSLLIEGTFAKSMDMLATSALYAKNSLAAMVAPIINELAPAVDYLVDQFVDLLNVINETLASLTGADTWTKAIKYPTQFAEAADDATGSAKKLRATLLGFDEINRLDDNNKGSRGKAGDQLDYSKMFEEKTVSTKAKNYVKAIKDAFKKGDLSKIGETLGENLKKGLDSIKWDDVKASVERNARSVATLINGFINVPDLGTKVGRTIAEVFNTAVRKMSTFFNTVEWHNVGKFLGDGINGILTTFNTRDLGRHIAGIINSAVTLIHNFVNTVEWKKFATFLADGINGFFTDINTKELGKTISDVLKKAAGFVVDLLRATDFQKIGDKIGDLIKGLDWVSILAGLASVVMNAITSALDLLVGLIKKSPLFGTVVALTIASKLAVAITGSGIASLIGTAIAKVVGDSAASSAVSSAVGTAMTKSVGSGASASAAAITARSTAAGVLAGVALTALAAVAIGWLADKITDGESTAWLEKAFGISLRKASHTGNEPTSNDTKRLNTWLTGGATKAYASGGVPETGSIFLAGERGAELISSSGGTTSVANRDQIAESVAIGNEESNDLLREQNSLLRALLAKDNSVQITTGQITSALNRANARSGNTVVAVG